MRISHGRLNIDEVYLEMYNHNRSPVVKLYTQWVKFQTKIMQ